MTEPGYPGYPTPEPGNQPPSAPGQYGAPQPSTPPPAYGAPQPSYGQPQQPQQPPQSYGQPQQPPPAYGQPQYGAPGQFAPAGPGVAPPGYASADDKTYALVSHFGGAAGNIICGIGGFIGPLIALLSKGKTSPTVRQHALLALNFQGPIAAAQIVLSIFRFILDASLTTGGFALSFLLGLVEFALFVVAVLFGILAGMKANEGQMPTYPLKLNLIK